MTLINITLCHLLSGSLHSFSDMFRGATSFNIDLGKWNVSQVTCMTDMFTGTKSFNRDYIKPWLTYMNYRQRCILGSCILEKRECVGEILQSHSDEVMAAVFSPDGGLLCSVSGDKTAKLWNVATRQCVVTLTGHTSHINAVSFSRDGRMICTASRDRSVKLWNSSEWTCIRTLRGHSDSCRTAAFSPDGKSIISGSSDTTLILWDLVSRSRIILKGHTDHVQSASFSSDGRLIASASADKTVRLWNSWTKKCTATFEGHSNWIRSVAFSPDATMIVSASRDHKLKLWHVESKSCVATLEGHSNWVQHVEFSPDGRSICSASDDKSAKVWDVKTKVCVGTLDGHTSYVNSCSFSLDGKFLCTSSSDESIKLWRIQDGDIASKTKATTFNKHIGAAFDIGLLNSYMSEEGAKIVEDVTECATAWSVVGFVISTSYAVVHVPFALTAKSVYAKFYAWILIPISVTAMVLSSFLKPKRTDRGYTTVLNVQYYLLCVAPELLSMYGYDWEEHQVIWSSARAIFWLCLFPFLKRVRRMIAALPDSDLSDFLSKSVIKDGLIVSLGQLAFLALSSIQCINEANMTGKPLEYCKRSLWSQSGLGGLVAIYVR